MSDSDNSGEDDDHQTGRRVKPNVNMVFSWKSHTLDKHEKKRKSKQEAELENLKSQYVHRSVDAYFKEALRIAVSRTPKAPLPPNFPILQDYHFFPCRLFEILEREKFYYRKYMGFKALRDPELGRDADRAQSEEQRRINESEPLADHEIVEKKKLLRKGFTNWTRRDFILFIKAIERHGRHNMRIIAASIDGKTPEEVREYSAVFWRRRYELQDIDEIMERIKMGEQRLMRIAEIKEALDFKVGQTRNPLENMKIPYDEVKSDFYENEDRFLVCMLQKIGIDNENLYSEMRSFIRGAGCHLFNFFMRSRPIDVLKERCDTLTRLIVIEYQDLKEKGQLKNLSDKHRSSHHSLPKYMLVKKRPKRTAGGATVEHNRTSQTQHGVEEPSVPGPSSTRKIGPRRTAGGPILKSLALVEMSKTSYDRYVSRQNAGGRQANVDDDESDDDGPRGRYAAEERSEPGSSTVRRIKNRPSLKSLAGMWEKLAERKYASNQNDDNKENLDDKYSDDDQSSQSSGSSDGDDAYNKKIETKRNSQAKYREVDDASSDESDFSKSMASPENRNYAHREDESLLKNTAWEEERRKEERDDDLEKKVRMVENPYNSADDDTYDSDVTESKEVSSKRSTDSLLRKLERLSNTRNKAHVVNDEFIEKGSKADKNMTINDDETSSNSSESSKEDPSYTPITRRKSESEVRRKPQVEIAVNPQPMPLWPRKVGPERAIDAPIVPYSKHKYVEKSDKVHVDKSSEASFDRKTDGIASGSSKFTPRERERDSSLTKRHNTTASRNDVNPSTTLKSKEERWKKALKELGRPRKFKCASFEEVLNYTTEMTPKKHKKSKKNKEIVGGDLSEKISSEKHHSKAEKHAKRQQVPAEENDHTSEVSEDNVTERQSRSKSEKHVKRHHRNDDIDGHRKSKHSSSQREHSKKRSHSRSSKLVKDDMEGHRNTIHTESGIMTEKSSARHHESDKNKEHRSSKHSSLSRGEHTSTDRSTNKKKQKKSKHLDDETQQTKTLDREHSERPYESNDKQKRYKEVGINEIYEPNPTSSHTEKKHTLEKQSTSKIDKKLKHKEDGISEHGSKHSLLDKTLLKDVPSFKIPKKVRQQDEMPAKYRNDSQYKDNEIKKHRKRSEEKEERGEVNVAAAASIKDGNESESSLDGEKMKKHRKRIGGDHESHAGEKEMLIRKKAKKHKRRKEQERNDPDYTKKTKKKKRHESAPRLESASHCEDATRLEGDPRHEGAKRYMRYESELANQ